MDVTGLTPGKEYKFRVSAVNAEGEGEPLVAEETIVAKNPFGEYWQSGNAFPRNKCARHLCKACLLQNICYQSTRFQNFSKL